MQMKMQMNLKKFVCATAIAGALGLPTFVAGAGAANAASGAPPIAGPVHTVQTLPADWHGDGWGDCDWCRHGDWDGGWRGDGDWHRGGWPWGGWPWGWRR